MKLKILAAALAALGMSAAHAQITNTQTGGANSASAATSAAGAASQSGAGAAAVIEQNFITPDRQRVDSTVSTQETSAATLNQDINYSGKYTIRNTPPVTAPNILPTSPCMGSSSLGVGVTGFGISGGTSWKDEDCGYRETARVFLQAGMPKDGIAVLCASPYAAQAPSCQALKPVAAPAKKSEIDTRADAKETMIRDMNDSNRTPQPTLTKSQYDKQITTALMTGSKAEQCAVYERTGDTFIMARMGCKPGK